MTQKHIVVAVISKLWRHCHTWQNFKLRDWMLFAEMHRGRYSYHLPWSFYVHSLLPLIFHQITSGDGAFGCRKMWFKWHWAEIKKNNYLLLMNDMKYSATDVIYYYSKIWVHWFYTIVLNVFFLKPSLTPEAAVWGFSYSNIIYALCTGKQNTHSLWQ